MTTPTNPDLLDRVRKLLAKAQDDGVTPHEAEALTAKAAELMARYGIDRALLGAVRPETDHPADRIFDLENPWGAVKGHLLAGVASALRCQCILLSTKVALTRVHVFGYLSDLERADILFTSLLVQMERALAAADPGYGNGWSKAGRRSFMLGFASGAVAKIRAAEEAAVASADAEGVREERGGQSAALVLADRSLTVRRQAEQAYPRTRKTRVTYTGSSYADGHAAGQRADIGGAKVGAGQGRALGR